MSWPSGRGCRPAPSASGPTRGWCRATAPSPATGRSPPPSRGRALAAAVAEHAGAALAEGVDPAAPEAAAVVERILAAGGPGPAVDRAGLADRLARFTDARVERYWALLGHINGWPAWPSQVPAFEWFIAALRAGQASPV